VRELNASIVIQIGSIKVSCGGIIFDYIILECETLLIVAIESVIVEIFDFVV
jgi:hypothetical protein